MKPQDYWTELQRSYAISTNNKPEARPFRAKLAALFSSRRFLTFLGTLGFIFLAPLAGLDSATITKISVASAAWILGDSLRETK